MYVSRGEIEECNAKRRGYFEFINESYTLEEST